MPCYHHHLNAYDVLAQKFIKVMFGFIKFEGKCKENKI